MRELAGHDYDRAQCVAQWPIREGLLAIEHRLRTLALESYRHARLEWLLSIPVSKNAPPEPPRPDLLKEPDGHT